MTLENSAILVEAWPTHEGRGEVVSIEARGGFALVKGMLFQGAPLPQWQLGATGSRQFVLKPDTPGNRAYYELAANE